MSAALAEVTQSNTDYEILGRMPAQHRMGLYNIFFNEFGRLRSGLRLVFYFLAFIAASLLLVTVMRAGFAIGREIAPSFPYAGFFAELTYRLFILAAALGAGYFCVRLLEG